MSGIFSRGTETNLHEVLNLLSSASGGSPSQGYGKHTETITSWTADGDLYYADVTHNLNSEDVAHSFRASTSSEFIFPERVKITSLNTLRVWMQIQVDVLAVVIR